MEHKESKYFQHIAWNEADEVIFIDYMASDELRFIEPGQLKKRRLTKKEKIARLESYIVTTAKRKWPKHLSEGRMRGYAIQVLDAAR